MKTEGWSNHEDTFEEALRREMLKLKKENNALRLDLKELTEAYYKILKEQKGRKQMTLEIGEEMVIPFKPAHHLKNTGILCKIEQIHSKNVYVRRFSERNNRWNKFLHQVDRSFLEQHKGRLNGVK